MNPKGPLWFVPVLLFGLFTFLSLNWHSHAPKFNYHSEIWADRAGYHVYLPATINYGFDASNFPKGLDKKTGYGFSVDSIPARIFTKYTCGVALLRLPFYLIGDLFRSEPSIEPAGFTELDHAMVDVAASFYGAAGITLLWILLRRRYGRRPATLASFGMLAGTNLLYYIVADPGMSHVYSFFLFALFLFLLARVSAHGWTVGCAMMLGATAGLTILVRPTNLVFLPIGAFLMLGTWQSAKTRARAFTQPAFLLPALVSGAAILVPQMLYWYYLYGVPVAWSYGSEGFTQWASPHFIPFWFAPYNGLFTYAPLLLVVLLISLPAMFKKKVEALTAWTAFIVVSYMSAAWFSWTFGCGFGARNIVEYTTILAFPIAVTVQSAGRSRWVIIGAIILCSAYTLKLMYSYDSCWFGTTWDWPMFSRILLGPFK